MNVYLFILSSFSVLISINMILTIKIFSLTSPIHL